MHSFLSSHCLETMGIQIWRQYRALPMATQTLDFTIYGLYNTAHERTGVLCLESLFIPTKQEPPLFRLLDAMLSAVQLKRAPSLDNCISPHDSLIILMGQSLAQKALSSEESLDTLRADNVRLHVNGAKLLVTYHPLDLLIEPANKAKAWEDLKKLRV